MKNRSVQNEALNAIVIQLALVLFLTPFLLIMRDGRIASSFCLGGLIAPIANSYFYFRVFSVFGAQRAKEILRAFYRGETIKILMTAIGFGVAFHITWISPLWLIIGYLIAQVGFLLSPIVMGKCNTLTVGMNTR